MECITGQLLERGVDCVDCVVSLSTVCTPPALRRAWCGRPLGMVREFTRPSRVPEDSGLHIQLLERSSAGLPLAAATL